ncbi:cytochrome P450 2U1-like [Branchiostoma floridae x Branchiostoma japonicum]
MNILLEILRAGRQYADLPTLLVACVCLLTYLYIRGPRNLPPGPWGWPLLGNGPMLAKSTFLPATLTELSKQYGDVMTIWIGRVPAIVLTGYETIRTALVKRAEDFSSRKTHSPIAKIRGDGITADGVIFAVYGPRWKQLRKFTVVTLRDFGVGKRSLEGKVNDEANALVQEVLSQNVQPFDIKIMLQNTVCNIIFSIAFGDRLDYDNPDFLRLIGMLNTAITNKPTVGDLLCMIHPVFRYIQPSGASLIETSGKLYEALREFCRERVEKHRLTFDPKNIRDFIDAFLLEQQQRDPDVRARENFSNRQLYEVLIDLFIAGTDTTGATTHWALLYMMLNPDIQEKVHQEIDSVLGQSTPSYAQRSLLPYTTATLAEVQRMKPVAPLSVGHAPSRDTTLNGYNIPKEAIIMANLWSVHMDPKLFPEPNTFRPERFLDQDGNFVKHEALVPFSMGPRTCLGEQLAKMELFLLFVSLMQRFTFHLPEGAPNPSTLGTYEMGNVVNLAPHFELCAVPRG